MRTRSWALAVAALTLLSAVLVTTGVLGPARRHLPREQRTVSVASASEAYTALSGLGIRGGTMVLLDAETDIVPRVYDRLFMEALRDDKVTPPFGSGNVTGGLIETGIVRAVHFVPPVERRSEIAERLGSRWDAALRGSRIDLRFYGAPIHVELADFDPSRLREKVVVYVDRRVMDEYDPAYLSMLMSPDVADVVVIVGER